MSFPFGPIQGPGEAPSGTATAGQVLSGATFSSAAAGRDVAGTMVSYANRTYSPQTYAQYPPAGYYAGLTIGAVPATGRSTNGNFLTGQTSTSFAVTGIPFEPSFVSFYYTLDSGAQTNVFSSLVPGIIAWTSSTGSGVFTGCTLQITPDGFTFTIGAGSIPDTRVNWWVAN